MVTLAEKGSLAMAGVLNAPRQSGLDFQIRKRQWDGFSCIQKRDYRQKIQGHHSTRRISSAVTALLPGPYTSPEVTGGEVAQQHHQSGPLRLCSQVPFRASGLVTRWVSLSKAFNAPSLRFFPRETGITVASTAQGVKGTGEPAHCVQGLPT